jgi:hypothetical protein
VSGPFSPAGRESIAHFACPVARNGGRRYGFLPHHMPVWGRHDEDPALATGDELTCEGILEPAQDDSHIAGGSANRSPHSGLLVSLTFCASVDAASSSVSCACKKNTYQRIMSGRSAPTTCP